MYLGLGSTCLGPGIIFHSLDKAVSIGVSPLRANTRCLGTGPEKQHCKGPPFVDVDRKSLWDTRCARAEPGLGTGCQQGEEVVWLGTAKSWEIVLKTAAAGPQERYPLVRKTSLLRWPQIGRGSLAAFSSGACSLVQQGAEAQGSMTTLENVTSGSPSSYFHAEQHTRCRCQCDGPQRPAACCSPRLPVPSISGRAESYGGGLFWSPHLQTVCSPPGWPLRTK